MVKSNTVTIEVRGEVPPPPPPPKPPEWIKYLGLLIPAAIMIWYLYKRKRGEVR